MYLAVYVTAGVYNGTIKAYSYYCRYIFHNYRHTCSFEYNDALIIIVNLSRGYNGNTADFCRAFAEFLREENFRAGISMAFRPIQDLPFFYRQAELALKYGRMDHPEQWSHHFGKCRCHYLVDRITGDFTKYRYFVPELHRLKECDQINGTEYIKTLSAYYQCGRNLSRAAKQANLHRSTLIYRLQKISEIIQMDLDAEENICLFQMFLFLEKEQKEVL